MENILLLVTSILALVGFILITIGIYESNRLINKFKDENRELRFDNEELSYQLNYSEKRVVNYARKIKTIEDIIIKNNKKNEYDTITLAEIKKELFIDTNQDK